jgi:antitoxin ParD1/3/4
MQNVERLSITLPSDMARMIRAKVEEGRYASNSEVIREAMRAWQEQEHRRMERLAVIRAKIDEADNDPRPLLSEEDVDRYFDEKATKSPAAQGDYA